MWRYYLPLAGLAALVAFFYLGLYGNPAKLPSPLIGKPAPLFSLPSLEDPGRKVSNRDYAGKPYVLNVWGTWCPGCRDEHATLLEISRRGGIALIGLNWQDQREAALQWLEQLGNPYTEVAFDGDGKVAIDWGIYGAPETFLVSADGRVLHKYIGPLTPAAWMQEFVPRIRAATAQSSAPPAPGASP
jgi:cytochrome c biogenesis protein CcmG/thiol:disulfide interchange protein DsbE